MRFPGPSKHSLNRELLRRLLDTDHWWVACHHSKAKPSAQLALRHADKRDQVPGQQQVYIMYRAPPIAEPGHQSDQKIQEGSRRVPQNCLRHHMATFQTTLHLHETCWNIKLNTHHHISHAPHWRRKESLPFSTACLEKLTSWEMAGPISWQIGSSKSLNPTKASQSFQLLGPGLKIAPNEKQAVWTTYPVSLQQALSWLKTTNPLPLTQQG